MASASEHLVSEYAGLSFIEIQNLDWIEYQILFRDAFIHAKRQTEEGRQWLADAWRFQQTKPDRNALRKKFGG